eukprot:3203441-Pleurochrysis_carterae.AAC.1
MSKRASRWAMFPPEEAPCLYFALAVPMPPSVCVSPRALFLLCAVHAFARKIARDEHGLRKRACVFVGFLCARSALASLLAQARALASVLEHVRWSACSCLRVPPRASACLRVRVRACACVCVRMRAYVCVCIGVRLRRPSAPAKDRRAHALVQRDCRGKGHPSG